MTVSGNAEDWSGPVRHHVVEPRVHVFQKSILGFDVASVLLLSERFNLVVDTLCCPADMLPVQMMVIRVGRSRPTMVVNTHSDWDHVWGNSTFHGHPIIGHQRCVERMKASGALEVEKMRAQYPGCPAIPLQLPDITFDGSLTLNGGDLTFHVMNTPGHTDDSVSIHVPELDLLLAGDTVEYPLPRLSRSGLTQNYIRELYHVSALKPKIVLPSHGPLTLGPDLIKANVSYLRALVQRVRSGLGAGQTVEQLQKEILPERLLPDGYDLDYEPGVRAAHLENVWYVYQELSQNTHEGEKLEGMV